MPIWNNNVAGAPNSVGYGYAINPGITVKPIDMRQFIDTPSSGGSGSRSSKSGSSDLDFSNMRAGVSKSYYNNSNIIESEINSLTSKASDAMYKAIKSGNETDLKNIQTLYNTKLNELYSMRLMNEAAKQNEILHFQANKDAYSKFQEDNNLNEYAITSDSSDLSNPYDFFHNNPFILKRDNKNVKILTNQEVLTDDNLSSYIDEKMNPTQAVIPHRISTSTTVQKNIQEQLDNAGSIEYLSGNPRVIYDNIVLSTTTNANNLNEKVKNIWLSLSPEDRQYITSRTLKEGIPTKKGVVSGNVYMNDIFNEQIKYNDALEKYEKALSENKADEAEKYKKEAEKAKAQGEFLSEHLYNSAMANAIFIAQGKSIGMVNKTYKTQKLSENDILRGGDGLQETKYSSMLQMLYASAEMYDGIMYFGHEGTDIPQLTYLRDQQGRPRAKTFNVTKDYKDIFAEQGGFGTKYSHEIKDKNLTLRDLGQYFIANGIYINKDMITNNDEVKAVDIASTGFQLPAFYNPTNNQLYSTDIKRYNGQVISKNYMGVVFEAKGNTKLPMIAADGKTIVQRELADIWEIQSKDPTSKYKTGYQVEKYGKKYRFVLLQEAPSPYYGSMGMINDGTEEVQALAQNADEGMIQSFRRIKKIQQSRYKTLQGPDDTIKPGIFIDGKLMEGTPADVYQNLKKQMNNPSYGLKTPQQRKMWIYNQADRAARGIQAVDPDRANEYRQGIINAYEEEERKRINQTENWLKQK
jgi:hypothetical protein